MFVKLFEHEWPERILHTIIHKIVYFLFTDNFHATGFSYSDVPEIDVPWYQYVLWRTYKLLICGDI